MHGTWVGLYDISTYNHLFTNYVSSNLTAVTEDLILLGLPVVSAGSLLLLKDNSPTTKPTTAPAPSCTTAHNEASDANANFVAYVHAICLSVNILPVGVSVGSTPPKN